MEEYNMEEKTQNKVKEKSEAKVAGSLLVVIRIHGMVKVKSDVAETLDRLRLRRKYACVLVDSKDVVKMGMLKRVKQFVAFGFVNDKMLKELVKARGMMVDKSDVDADKVVKGLLEGKSLSDLKLKPFFRLHPPRKGIKSKLHFPKGVLGDNGKKINDLVGRML
ncbi:50S ribosomal protein L30 [archaeon]|jgi:large subunit ribosomal protein L30|nr:50S ribosomal protein L30 [archaeon]